MRRYNIIKIEPKDNSPCLGSLEKNNSTLKKLSKLVKE